LLEQQGAEAVVTDTPSSGDLLGATALLHLGALRPGGRPVLPSGVGLIRDALAVGVRSVLVPTAGGGSFGGIYPGGGSPGGVPTGGMPVMGPATGGTRLPGGTWRGGDEEHADRGLRGWIRTGAAA